MIRRVLHSALGVAFLLLAGAAILSALRAAGTVVYALIYARHSHHWLDAGIFLVLSLVCVGAAAVVGLLDFCLDHYAPAVVSKP